MKRAKIAELKNSLSRYLDHVREGGQVLVMDRDRPVARIVPVEPASEGADDRLDRLERRGLVRKGSGGAPAWLGRRRPARVKGSVLGDLLAERGEAW
ncbi:MAG: type II toxin-antitoxin system prevent-host-death family antitoxin [Vicinamibacteria bacterium]|nr:type II toxin-antitoxin system prevent-host-death family antitoxin [Vicinamibacteria bacterium]